MSRIPHVAATIVPFDTTLDPDAIDRIEERQRVASREPALTTSSVSHPVASAEVFSGTLGVRVG